VLSKCNFKSQQIFDEWIQRVAIIIEKIDSNIVERETLIVKAIKWSSTETNQKNPLMHKLIANIMAKEQNYEQARYHSLLSKNGHFCAKILIQLSGKAFTNEVDMIIVQVVLNLLILNDKSTAMDTFEYYTKYHPEIRTETLPFRTALLNFLYFLLHIIDDKKLQAFNTLCDLYKTALSRDPMYEKQLEKIATLYFNAPVKREQRSGGLFGDLFNQLFQELENDSDSGDESSSSHNKASTTSNNYTNVDLD
jgi:hypothetical protein